MQYPNNRLARIERIIGIPLALICMRLFFVSGWRWLAMCILFLLVAFVFFLRCFSNENQIKSLPDFSRAHEKAGSFFFTLAAALMLAGCSDSQKPLESGGVVSGTVWKHSLQSSVTENSGSDIPKDARVDVYQNLIVIHLADGSREIVPLDYVPNLKLKATSP